VLKKMTVKTFGAPGKACSSQKQQGDSRKKGQENAEYGQTDTEQTCRGEAPAHSPVFGATASA
jgi:hypothetical protein